ncbi:alpha/beta hydrolase family protein [Stutzerimonas xanthomarina]|uniref:alpha/beta hydrolase family protein n=1 Tax=Stutzerimonas xanthomarina TaxID=271420 RepID=UPI003AA87E71
MFIYISLLRFLGLFRLALPASSRFLNGLLAATVAAALIAIPASAADEPATPETPAPPTPTPAERPPLPSRSDAMSADLLRQLPAKEFVSLTAGTDEFAALWRPANVGEPRGVIILLPGEGESADWPLGIGPLRRGLPDHGWHTLSMSLPDLSGPVYPAVGNVAEDAAEPLAEEAETGAEQLADDSAPSEAGYLPEETAAVPSEPAIDDTETEEPDEPPAAKVDQAEQIAERIEAALAFARSKQPSTIVLVGQGTGGYWAARYLQQVAPSDVRHLAMIQPRQPEGQNERLEQLVPALKLATGDFFYKGGRADLSAAHERLNASRRIQHPAYRQVELPPPTGDRHVDQEQLVRRIRGWLDKQT